MSKETKSKRKPTLKKSTVAPGLRAQPHGGALLTGGVPGHSGGSGRPSRAIRAEARMAFGERIGVLKDIADGAPLEEFSAPLASILPHVRCPKCDGKMEPGDAATLALVSIKGTRPARPGDRTKAIDTLGKYGLGEADDDEDILKHPLVQEFITSVALAAAEIFGEEGHSKLGKRIIEIEGQYRSGERLRPLTRVPAT